MDGSQHWRALKYCHPELVSRMAVIIGDTLLAISTRLLRGTGLLRRETPFNPEQLLTLAVLIDMDSQETVSNYSFIIAALAMTRRQKQCNSPLAKSSHVHL